MTNTVAFQIVSMTPNEAAQMYKTDWWINSDVQAAAQRQLFTEQMIMPFEIYYEGLKKLLGRDVNRAEVLLFDDLRREFLGLKTKPSGDEVDSAVQSAKEQGLLGAISGVLREPTDTGVSDVGSVNTGVTPAKAEVVVEVHDERE